MKSFFLLRLLPHPIPSYQSIRVLSRLLPFSTTSLSPSHLFFLFFLRPFDLSRQPLPLTPNSSSRLLSTSFSLLFLNLFRPTRTHALRKEQRPDRNHLYSGPPGDSLPFLLSLGGKGEKGNFRGLLS